MPRWLAAILILLAAIAPVGAGWAQGASPGALAAGPCAVTAPGASASEADEADEANACPCCASGVCGCCGPSRSPSRDPLPSSPPPRSHSGLLIALLLGDGPLIAMTPRQPAVVEAVGVDAPMGRLSVSERLAFFCLRLT